LQNRPDGFLLGKSLEVPSPTAANLQAGIT